MYDVIIIGAGAGGLMCAIEAGKRGRRVLVAERAEKIGKKIRISGGGRCNFTNLFAERGDYISSNPHFCTSALARYTPQDFITLVRTHHIAFHEKKDGQLFCDNSAQEITDMLLRECRDVHVRIELNCKVQSMQYSNITNLATASLRHISHHGESATQNTNPIRFHLQTNLGDQTGESLVIATGGLTIPKIGATDFGYRIATQFGLNIIEAKPALVPFVFSDDMFTPFRALSGVSLYAEVNCNEKSFRDNILFTHLGLSGPAILQISSYWNDGDEITINLLPDEDGDTILLEHRTSKTELRTLLSSYLPKRFVDVWCAWVAPSKPLNQYSSKQLARIAHHVHHWKLKPSGTEGFAKAEVTRGGIDTKELSSKTMESKKNPGLYFIGEVVDVTGHLGGFNFQWAWSSGWVAGQVV